MLLRYVSQINLILISSHPISIQGRKPNLADFVKEALTLGVFRTFGQISFTVGMVTDIFKLYCLCQFECPLLSFNVTVVRESRKCCTHLLANMSVDLLVCSSSYSGMGIFRLLPQFQLSDGPWGHS